MNWYTQGDIWLSERERRKIDNVLHVSIHSYSAFGLIIRQKFAYNMQEQAEDVSVDEATVEAGGLVGEVPMVFMSKYLLWISGMLQYLFIKKN